MNQYDEDPVVRFNQRYIVNEETGCWEWQGRKTTKGYGYFTIGRKRIKAHRYAYSIYNGPLESELVIMHTCDNRICVNPKHLVQGSIIDNNKDMYNKGRYVNHNAVKTLCIRGHALEGSNLITYSNGHRKCKECHNARRREYYAKNRNNNNSNA